MPSSRKDKRLARKKLIVAEESARTAVVEECKASDINITSAYSELKKANENAFVMVDAPVASQVATNRFGLFSAITSSIGYAASCLNPFGKRG